MKTLPITLLFILSMFLSSHVAHAQSNFRRGYVITIQQDTISGLIDYRTDILNAQRCVFKADTIAKQEIYYPGDILGYRFVDDGKYYVTRKITLQHGIENTLFLEYLLQGVKNLYYYESDLNEQFYFIEEDSRFVKLDAPVLEKEQEGKEYKKQVRRYIPTLQFLFQEYPSLQTKVKKIPFTHPGLIGIVKEYNDLICDGREQCIIFETKEDRKLLSVDIAPYVGVAKYTFPSATIESNGTPKLSYLAGVHVSIYCIRWARALSFVADLSIARQEFEGGEWLKHYSSVLLTPKLGARYTFPCNRWRPFIGMGGEICLIASEKGEIGSQSYNEGFGGGCPGGYIEAGVQFKVDKNWKRYFILRGQFEGMRDMFERRNLFRIWSASLGFAF